MHAFLASLEQCIEGENRHAAICLTLVLPEMAGAVESPQLEPRQRYSEWFDRWVGGKYRTSLLSGPRTFLSGSDCYALKCAMLYQGLEANAAWPHASANVLSRYAFILDSEAHCTHKNRVLQVSLDLFCRDVLEGGRAWLSAIEKDSRKAARLKQGLNLQPFNEQ